MRDAAFLDAAERRPQRIANVEELEELLSRPDPAVVATMRSLPGDVMILGAGGKIGPTLARMARRASDAAGVPRRVIAVSRFSDAAVRARLESWGIETIAGDLLDHAFLQTLPAAENIVYAPAFKFGGMRDPSSMWALNTYLAGRVAERFAGCRIVAYSSGNVYGFVPAGGGGARETDPPEPVGEYGNSVLGRERVLEYFSRRDGTPMAILRLFYANELRYGTIRDVAELVFADRPVDVTMPKFNAIWQGDSNALTLRCFELVQSPPTVLNLTGPWVLDVRDVARAFGCRFGKSVRFRPPTQQATVERRDGGDSDGEGDPPVLLGDASQILQRLRPALVPPERMFDWVADWIARGGVSYGKPTHFQVRDGRF